ncbi:Teichoic acid translocation permease protein TagG [hydrothermal vent metagenome]|uniref:Teichoic acid translocation permease protein TagG n=1 Tax=hydrothermal vent metagenome TaxID=652676 RepID=A0A1W1CB25_9ZZZZ
MLGFLKAIFQSKTLLWSLTKSEFKQRYVGNLLGMLWAFIQPAAMIGIFWFVFQVGFKSKPVDNFPFILWLVSGMFPWFYFAEALSMGTNAILSNAFLVKKVVFRVSLLPIIPILSALAIHIFFIFFMFAMFIYYGYSPEIYWLQIPYYVIASSILLLGLSWLTSSIVIFFKDIGQLVAIVIQFGFWLTPIFWSLKMVPEKYHWIIELNPMVYIIDGYRNAMIYQHWFWEDISMMVYFWTITLLFFLLGAFTFRKLKPHFADVL